MEGTAGLQFYFRPSDSRGFDNTEEIRAESSSESAEIVKESIGASMVVCIQPLAIVRGDSEAGIFPCARIY